MNILFNMSQSGAGNNGGTKTIIRCAETLQDMGHSVAIWANIDNYTWHSHRVCVRSLLDSCHYHFYGDSPDIEVIVSVWELPEAIKDMNNIVDKEYINKVWWCRGWEKWVRGEPWLIEQIKKFVAAGGRIVVNSSWLIDQLKEKAGVDSVLCWAGLDLDVWEDNDPIKHIPPTIGSLGESKHKTKRHDLCKSIIDCEGSVWYETTGTQNNKQLKSMYNQCDIWFAPTELEGFHQCPAEANLCGCLVVCNRMPSNGMGDYATDETAMRYDTWDELIECIENPDFSKVSKMQKVLREKIGNREDNMRKFVEILEG